MGREMARFPGIVVLVITCSGDLDVFSSRLDKEVLTTVKFLVEFKLPTLAQRVELWKRAIPPKLPVDRETLKLEELAAESKGFSAAQIGNAVYRAAAVAALRSEILAKVSMTDL